MLQDRVEVFEIYFALILEDCREKVKHSYSFMALQ